VTTQREHMQIELDVLRRRLVDVSAPGRQVQPTDQGREYRHQLEEDIRELEERLASEKD
jgi:hypothetical protein